MKRILAVIALILLSTGSLFAQKLVIGSQVTDHKLVEGVKWYTTPRNPESIWIIDFYSSDNPSSVEFYSRNIDRIYGAVTDNVEIVVLSNKLTDDFKKLIEEDGAKYVFGHDSKATLFKLFGVKYIPYTVVVDNKGKVLWQGDLSKLTDSQLQKIL